MMDMTRINSGFLPSFFGNLEGDLFNQKQRSLFSKVAVNISERDNDYLVEVAAPGFSKDDFEVEVDGNKLSIRGANSEKKVDDEVEDKYTHQEFSYNEFARTFTLPKDVNTQHIEADYKNGILKVIVTKPVVKQKVVKKIEIKG